MNGNVYRRAGGEWAYRFEAGQHPMTGKRMRFGKSGFATKREAAQALREAITTHEKARSVRTNRQSVEQFLNDWHTAVRSSLRATTWVNYRDYIDAYVIPHIGDSRGGRRPEGSRGHRVRRTGITQPGMLVGRIMYYVG